MDQVDGSPESLSGRYTELHHDLQCPHTTRVKKEQAHRDRIVRDIERAVARCKAHDRLLYRPYAILPEPEVGR